MNSVRYTETSFTLAHDELQRIVLDHLKNRRPAEYDNMILTGSSGTHRLANLETLRVTFHRTEQEI